MPSFCTASYEGADCVYSIDTVKRTQWWVADGAHDYLKNIYGNSKNKVDNKTCQPPPPLLQSKPREVTSAMSRIKSTWKVQKFLAQKAFVSDEEWGIDFVCSSTGF